ncbi:MAG: OmpA family protein [Terracidiphilus sp.]|jgi:outer membrane protein OmpA-like peptidoglycan-associated protein
MKLIKTSLWIAVVCAVLLLVVKLPAQTKSDSKEARETNLLSWGAGALVVVAPPSYSDHGQWSTEVLLDELPNTGWATRDGDLTPKVFVFELANKSEISSLSFDTAQVENPERGAKDVKVEISDSKNGVYTLIATPTLAKVKDHQRFQLKTPATGRYLRLTAVNNWGDPKYMEIMDVYAYGKPLEKRVLPDNSGAFSSSYGKFHMQQLGSTVNGCYEHKDGLIENGGFDGRVLRFTWSEADSDGKRESGPAIVVFSDDGQTFTGYWWYERDVNNGPSGRWEGQRVSRQIGFCPYWKPGTGNGVVDQLKSEGRARLYGILFDTDSDHLKDESKPTLDSLAAAAKAQPSWRFGIEGYTDNVGGDGHNQTLSEKRAASVKAYLVTAGVAAPRLTTQGFGSSKPVASNDTELGRSQNRRVEVVKK